MENEFDIQRAKTSVKDLSSKVKHLKGLRTTLRDTIRIEVRAKKPGMVLTWDDYRQLYFGADSITTPWTDGSRIGWAGVQEKLLTRRGCSRFWLLAYAFARGVPYRKVEPGTKKPQKLDLDFGISLCLAEISSAPGIKPTEPDGSFRYYSSTGETRAYIDDLQRRLKEWILIEAPKSTEADESIVERKAS